MKIIIGSRGSKLALWQASWVGEQLTSSGFEVEIRIIKTSGDRLTHVTLTRSGTKGLFVKEIEDALAAGEIDLAVHSMKDLPTVQPDGLVVAAVPAREDARDVLISREGIPLAELPGTARVATSSLRRQAQLRALHPGLEVVPIRGNLDTRVRKLEDGQYDALVVAAAGVHRLGLAERITAYFEREQMCPAVGQGALAIEVREGDDRIRQAVRPLDHHPTHQSVSAERAALHGLGGGCLAPIAAHAFVEQSTLHLMGLVASVDGRRVLRASGEGPADGPEEVGGDVARKLLKQGADELLQAGN